MADADRRMIETARLRLVSATLRELEAELESPSALAAVARMEVPGTWPPELMDRDPLLFIAERLRAHPEEAGWWLYYFVLTEDGAAATAIGCGGYKGPPCDGTVEIGYSVLREYRRRGLATEAALALAHTAFENADVDRVIAETLPELTSSIGVLEKCGFRSCGAGSDEGVVRYELRRERRRP